MLIFTNNRVRFGVMTRVFDCAFDFIAYDLVKTKLLEYSVVSRSSVLGGPEDEPCDWFIPPLRTAYDPDNLIFTRWKRRSHKRNLKKLETF